MTSCWPQVCIEHYLNIEQCGWGVPDRNDWFEAVFSDTFKWIFRITRNSKLNLHELLARAVVHLGEWYPYLVHVASTMCNPQRKKDFFMIDYVLFALYKILFVLPKKKTISRKPFLSPTKFSQLLPNFKNAVENIWKPTIFCQVLKSSVPWQLSFAGSSYFANITVNCMKNFMCSDANKVTKRKIGNSNITVEPLGMETSLLWTVSSVLQNSHHVF